MSPIEEMREIIRETSPVHAKHMSDQEIFDWFKNKADWAFELDRFKRANNLPPEDHARHKRIINCWTDYILLEEVQSSHEAKGNYR